MATKYVNIVEIGKGGIILDQPPFALPPETWSGGANVAMRRNLVMSGPGMARLDVCTPSLSVRHMLPIPTSSEYYWCQVGSALGAGASCLYSPGGDRDVTPAAGISIDDDDQWSGGLLNSVPVMSNGHLNPPYYLPDIGGAGIWSPLPFTIVDGSMTESWVDKNITCAVLRPFKNFLFALDISRDAGRYPHMVMWSDAADPGTIPQWQDWTTLDPANLGGEVSLGETGGFLVDAVPLGDLLMIYKEDSIWSASFVGGEYVFRFRKAITDIGAMSPNCIASFKRGHVVFGDGDIVLHNGTSAQSIVADRVRRHIFRQINPEAYRNSFVVADHEHQEVWCCFPPQGHSHPSVAAVWNWRHDTWTVQELPTNTYEITTGVNNFDQDAEGDAWGAGQGETDVDGSPIDPVPYDPAVWGGDGVDIPYSKYWGERTFNPTLKTMVGTDGVPYKIDFNIATQFGTIIDQHIERIGIPLLEHDRYGVLRRVYPQIKASGPVNFYIGSQDYPTDAVEWEGPISFDPSIQSFFNCLRHGRLFALKLENEYGVSFEFYGLKGEITPTGRQ